MKMDRGNQTGPDLVSTLAQQHSQAEPVQAPPPLSH
jgi:hypothetical protein